jgi:hypothetical protein
MINYEQVITYRVVAIDVPPGEESRGTRDRRAFLIEDLIAKLLRLTYLCGCLSESHFHCADPAHCP